VQGGYARSGRLGNCRIGASGRWAADPAQPRYT